ncbi:hypothetical protein D3C87_901720 [compost metagenome]
MTRIYFWEEILGKTISDIIENWNETTIVFNDGSYTTLSTEGNPDLEGTICFYQATFDEAIGDSVVISTPTEWESRLRFQEIKDFLIGRRIISLLVPMVNEARGNPTLPTSAVKMGLFEDSTGKLSMYWISSYSMTGQLLLRENYF